MFVREDTILPRLDAWLATLFDPDNLDATCEALAVHQEVDESAVARAEAANGSWPTATTGWPSTGPPSTPAPTRRSSPWIAEVRAERDRAEVDIAGAKPAKPMTRAEVKAIVLAMQDMAKVLRRADPKLKAEVYADLGLKPYRTSPASRPLA